MDHCKNSDIVWDGLRSNGEGGEGSLSVGDDGIGHWTSRSQSSDTCHVCKWMQNSEALTSHDGSHQRVRDRLVRLVRQRRSLSQLQRSHERISIQFARSERWTQQSSAVPEPCSPSHGQSALHEGRTEVRFCRQRTCQAGVVARLFSEGFSYAAGGPEAAGHAQLGRCEMGADAKDWCEIAIVKRRVNGITLSPRGGYLTLDGERGTSAIVFCVWRPAVVHAFSSHSHLPQII